MIAGRICVKSEPQTTKVQLEQGRLTTAWSERGLVAVIPKQNPEDLHTHTPQIHATLHANPFWLGEEGKKDYRIFLIDIK